MRRRLNGESTTGMIAECGVIDRLLEQNSDPITVVTTLYERCLSRQPSAEEAAVIGERLQSSPDLKASLSDLPATLQRVIPSGRALHFSPAKRHGFSPPFTDRSEQRDVNHVALAASG